MVLLQNKHKLCYFIRYANVAQKFPILTSEEKQTTDSIIISILVFSTLPFIDWTETLLSTVMWNWFVLQLDICKAFNEKELRE